MSIGRRGEGQKNIPLLSSRLDGRERLMTPIGIALVGRRVVMDRGVWLIDDAECWKILSASSGACASPKGAGLGGSALDDLGTQAPHLVKSTTPRPDQGFIWGWFEIKLMGMLGGQSRLKYQFSD